MRLAEGFQQRGATALDVGFARCPARAGAQRSRLACQGPVYRLHFKRLRKRHRFHALVDKCLQLGSEAPGIPDFDLSGEAAHILHRDARQVVGNEIKALGHGHLPQAKLKQ